MLAVTFRSGLYQPDAVKRWSWHYLLPLVQKLALTNYAAICLAYMLRYSIISPDWGYFLWVLKHKGTGCSSLVHICAEYLSTEPICNLNPCCTNNSRPGRRRREDEFIFLTHQVCFSGKAATSPSGIWCFIVQHRSPLSHSLALTSW